MGSVRPTAPCPGRLLAPPCRACSLDDKGRILISNRQNRRRGRGGQRGPQGGRSDNRNRGNASQLLEKYKGLARDAQMSGDRVQAEYYLQFADHYFRVLEEIRLEQEKRQEKQQGKKGRQRDDHDRDHDDARDEDGDDEAAREDGKPERKPRRKPKAEQPDEGGEDKPQRKPRQRRKKDAGDEDAPSISADALPPAISADDEADAA